MPLVTLTISYEDEEFGQKEKSTYQKEVEDLDVYSWLWYLIKASETAGYDFEDIQAFSKNGKVYRTEP